MNGANACVAERNMRNRDILAETMRGTCQTARTSDYLSGSSSGLFMYPSEQG